MITNVCSIHFKMRREKNSFMNVPNILMIVQKVETTLMSINRQKDKQDFRGGPVAKIPCVQCRGHEFVFWLGELRSHMPCNMVKKLIFF